MKRVGISIRFVFSVIKRKRLKIDFNLIFGVFSPASGSSFEPVRYRLTRKKV